MKFNLLQFFIITILLIVIIIFPFGLYNYNGSLIYYISFSFLSNFLLLYSLRKSAIFFETFFSIFIWLGFWFKFTIQISFLNSMFPEGVGKFDYSPNSYDDAIFISSIAVLSVILFSFIRERFFFTYEKLEKKIEIKTVLIKFYSLFRKEIILYSLIFTLIICIINLNFSFFQKGTVPDFILPFKFNYLFNWLLMFGLSSLFCFLIYFEFLIRNKNSNNIIKYAFFENFLSAISTLSRGMIFNSGAIFFGYYKLLEYRKIKIKNNIFVKYLIIIFVLFFISLLIVSKIRQNNNFPVGHEVHSYIPTIEVNDIEVNDKNKPILNMTNQLILETNQILFLIAGRFVGIDAVMAVQGNDKKGFELFYKSFNENFDYNNSFYENEIKKSFHIYKNKPKVYTIYVPGLIAFLYYTNSALFVFFSVLFICFFCSFLELMAYKVSNGNLIFSSLIGSILSYRLAHFGYMPLDSYKIILAILINFILFYILIKIITLKFK